MHTTKLPFRLPKPFNQVAMFHRVASGPLQTSASAGNIAKPANTKRKFERMMSNSSLQHLQQNVSFDENNSFDDEIYLAKPPQSPPHKTQKVDYPQLPPSAVPDKKESSEHRINYPQLSPAHQQNPNGLSSRQVPPSSSGAAPWSSSPPHHFQPGHGLNPPAEEPRPSKRRPLPWAESRPDVPSKGEDKTARSPHLWNKPTSMVKDEQKEFRKRGRVGKEVRESSEPAKKPIAVEKGPIELSKEQKTVIKAVCEDRKSVFFTGSAGTGKSVLMRSIIAKFKDKFRREPDRLAITASTGLAACVIEGQTLHSWAGIGLGKEPVPELVRKIRRNAKSKTRWLRTSVLVVDEISMVDGTLFDKLEQVARVLRNNPRPFGGIQLVVTGDFFQLPPVPDKNTQATFAFDATTWNTCIDHTILLSHVFRQKDPVFASMLNEMRMGRLSPATVARFQSLSRGLDFQDDVEATELFPTRYEVENANNMRMKNLSGQAMTFDAIDSGRLEAVAREKLLQNFIAPKSITLKKGAQVMLIKNIDTQLVNGSLGKIQSFMDESTFLTYKFDEEAFNMAQEPPGGDNEDQKAAAREKIKKMRLQGNRDAQARYWPMVRFSLADGTYRDLLCQPEEWKTEDQQGEILAKRVQIPLILSWALSIHKAQGQTLSRVKVDLGRVFERGQAYVALSRATSQEGLQVLRFREEKVMVHPKVTAFYSKLANVDSLKPSKVVKKTSSVNTSFFQPPVVQNQPVDDDDDDDDYYEDADVVEALYA